MNWALRQRLASTQQQCLLYVVADSADPNGLTRHCDPIYMEVHARMPSRASLFRRLKELEELGLLRRSKFYSERGAPIYEIQLDLTVFVDVPVKRRKAGDADDDDSSNDTERYDEAPKSQAETLVSETKVSPSAAPESHSCDSISPPLSKDSPLPPSGGVLDELDGWKEFQDDWEEPITRHAKAQQEWAKLSPEQRVLARQAARGYVAHRKAQKKPPHLLGAHLFLRDRGAWPKLAEYAPEVAPIRTGIASHSAEADAIRALYAVARCTPFEHKGRVVHRGEITPQILAFATAGAPSGWPWITEVGSISAWANFLDVHIRVPRPPLVRDGTGLNAGRGIFAPWQFPPSVKGKTYPITGPPPGYVLGELSDEEAEEFK